MVGNDVDASSGADTERISSRGSIRPGSAWSARAGIPLASSTAARVAFALHAAVEQGRPGMPRTAELTGQGAPGNSP